MPFRTKSSQQKATKQKHNSVKGLKFFSKSRLQKLKSSDTQNYLKTANKYIFVQDFDKAESLLNELCIQHPNDYEILFRRVEVATKRGTLESLHEKLKKLEHIHKDSNPIAFAKILCAIRLLLNTETKTEAKKPVFNQKTDLSKHVEMIYSNKTPFVNILSNKKIRLNRTLEIPDDYYPEEENFEDQFAKVEVSNNLKNKSSEPNSKEELLENCQNLLINHSENYAAWYLMGCALESVGQLNEAIDKWNKAYELNPNSISVLATLAELQQIGVLPEHFPDYTEKFQSIDKHLVHGNFETHTSLYNEFINSGDYKNAIGSLKTLADWLQKQYGEVPIEIEILCLLGAMQAYKLSKNIAAAEACKAEVENLVIACKKSPRDMSQLYFIAQLCEEYGLKSISRICYFAILISKETNIELLVQTASHCVSHTPSDGLLECLKVAYKNSRGNVEIRFCILLCGLKIDQIDLADYMKKKNTVREIISTEKNHANLLPILLELYQMYKFDPEINYYLAEVYMRKNENELAKSHFQMMFANDSYNTDSTLKYILFLLKSNDYSNAKKVAEESLSLDTISEQQANELHWSISAAYFSEGSFDKAYYEIQKAIESDPWNPSYLILLIRTSVTNSEQNIISSNKDKIAKDLEECVLNPSLTPAEKRLAVLNLHEFGNQCLLSGYSELAWSIAKAAFLLNENNNEELLNFLAKAGASYNHRIAVQHILLLLKQKNNTKDLNFAALSTCIAQMYSLSGNWPLVDEWLSISKINKGFSDKGIKQKLFELEALSITMKGSDLKKAQNLLEAAIESYDNIHKVPLDTKVLHGYILVAQGNFHDGIEKMQSNITDSSSIQSLYFLVKGLERAGQLNNSTKESITQLYHIFPTNSFEQKMIEEIFFAVGAKNPISPVGLAC